MPRVAVVLATATGGTARHAGMLAEGCRRAGLSVLAAGPAATQPAFLEGAASLPAVVGTAASPAEAGADHGRGGVAGAAAGGSGTAGGLRGGGGAASEAPGPGDVARAAAGGPGQAGEIPWFRAEIAAGPRPVRDAVAVAALLRMIRSQRPDIVHAHGLRAGALAAAAAAALPGARRPALVVTVHNGPPSGRAARAVHAALELACARRADVVLCASADLARRLRRRGAAAIEFDVPALPAPPPAPGEVARARAALGPPGRPAVLAVGRLAPQKGLDTLLAAAARWQHRDPPPAVAIAGEGPLAGALAAAARRDGIDLVLLGRRGDVPALLAAADVVAVPSRWEARALVVQEAMAAGRPIVATRTGGIPGLTGEDAAVLVPPGDAGQLAAAVAAVLDDPGLAARLAAAALRRAAALPGPAEAVAAVLNVYEQVGAGQNQA